MNTGQGRRRLNARAALRTVAIAGRAGERSDSPGRLLSDAAMTASDGTAAAAAAVSAPAGAPSAGDQPVASTKQQQAASEPARVATRPPGRPAGRGRARGRGTGAGRGRPPKCDQPAASHKLNCFAEQCKSPSLWLPFLGTSYGGQQLQCVDSLTGGD